MDTANSGRAPVEPKDRAHVIVVGNEKGGTGKSTVAMHLMASLMGRGLSVGCVDLDARQATVSTYVKNRGRYAEDNGLALPMPELASLLPSTDNDRAKAARDDDVRLGAVMQDFTARFDAVVIDTPGSDSPLSRSGHAYADTLVTPLNDSFVDLDVIAKVDADTRKIERPSHYADMVWQTRQRRAQHGLDPTDWIVLRNRLSHLDARNKRRMERLLDVLSKRPGVNFRVVPGLGERVIYRELFVKGLTLLDLLREDGAGVALSMSHVAARQELRTLVDALGLETIPRRGVSERISERT